MAPAAGALAAALDAVPVAPAPEFPVAANVSGGLHDCAAGGGRALRALLVAQVFTPVAWADCVGACGRRGGRAFVEVAAAAGVRGTLAGAAARAARGAPWAAGATFGEL